MKQPSQNELELLNIIKKVEAQIALLDKKLDILIHRSLPAENKPSVPRPPINPIPLPAKPNEHKRERVLHKAICADCQKECTIPFKPTGDRPVYCQECFSRRKSGHAHKVVVDNKPKEIAPIQPTISEALKVSKPKAVKSKKIATVKKPAAKKKPVAKGKKK